MDSSVYDADYYLRGVQTGKSLYEDYRWMGQTTLPMVASMVRSLGIAHKDSILDFGCARGFLVRAFRELAFCAWGTDHSEWAVENADETVKQYLYRSNGEIRGNYDWIIAKDVLEHVEPLYRVVNDMLHRARVGIFVVVPLSERDGEPYVCPEYEKDVTHLHRLTLPTWAAMFSRPGWVVEMRYKLPWIKQNWYKPGCEHGNGFITCRRED